MELYKIAVRALFAYVVLLALMRASGKRVVSEASARDFVVALIIGDLIDDLLWAEVGAAQFTAATGGVIVAGLMVALATYTSSGLATVLNGKPQLVLGQGVPVRSGMRAERVNEKELAALLRVQGVERARWGDVHRAWLEESGELSISWNEEMRPARRQNGARIRRKGSP